MAATLDLHSRRVKFILALSLAIGVGVTVWPYAFLDMRASPYTANFWQCADCSQTMKGLRNGVSIFLSTGYCIGTVIAMLLNAVLPEDAGVEMLGDKIDEAGVDETNKTGKLVDGEEEADEEEVDVKKDSADPLGTEIEA